MASGFRALRRLLRDTAGISAVEFALVLPVLLTVLAAGLELSRVVMASQKVDRATATVGDLVSQARDLAEGDLASVVSAADIVMAPYDLAGDGVVIVTSIGASGGGVPVVNWQRRFGSGTGASHFGAEGAAATLPSGLLVRDDESVIVSEVFLHYAPALFGALVPARDIYDFTVYRPRFAPLTTLDP